MPFGFLALLAAFGALANSLRSNSASALIRTQSSVAQHGLMAGDTSRLVRFANFAPVARPLRELRPGCSFASLTLPGLGFPHSSTLTSFMGTARRAPTTSILIPHPSLLTPHSSLLTPHSSLTPHPSPLTPHPSLLPPHSSPLTPHSSLLTPHSYVLTPHSSLLTPHPSLQNPKPSENTCSLIQMVWSAEP